MCICIYKNIERDMCVKSKCIHTYTYSHMYIYIYICIYT